MEKWKDHLAALVPCYDEHGGNATLIYTLHGTVEPDRRTVKWNLRRLARLHCIDLEAVRRKHGRALECYQGVPLPFTARLVLVPLKVRQPVGKNDGSYGYFNPAAVQDCLESKEEGARSRLVLPGGNSILCQYTARTVRRRLKAGELVLEKFRQQANLLAVEWEGARLPALPGEWRRLLASLLAAIVAGDRQEQL